MTDFSFLLQTLDTAGVEFILVGGVAATVHGSARLTLDLDIVYRRTKDNLRRVIGSLEPYAPYLRGAPPGLPFLWDIETLERGLNFTLITKLGPIDLLGTTARRPVPPTPSVPIQHVDQKAGYSEKRAFGTTHRGRCKHATDDERAAACGQQCRPCRSCQRRRSRRIEMRGDLGGVIERKRGEA